MIKLIEEYFENQKSVYIDIATALDYEDGFVYIMLAPEYTMDNDVEVYDENGHHYKVLHCDTVDDDDPMIQMLLDLNNNGPDLHSKRHCY